jgi:Circularly permutated YpsA SLOG family
MWQRYRDCFLSSVLQRTDGGQTGVDRGALDAALAAGFPCGGWCPADRRAEDGPIPQRYPLTPLPGGGYRQRTRQNLIDSDGTAILFYGTLSGGTKLTRDSCVREKNPFVVLDAKLISETAAAAAIVRFIEENAIQVLNVAGPRLSGWLQGHAFALGVLGKVIAHFPPTT